MEDATQDNRGRFRGLFVPHVTPLSESGTLDLQSLEALTEHLASANGVAGLVSCARIGEGPVLTSDEKRRVCEISGQVAHKAGKLHIATIAPQSTDEAITAVRNLERLPVDAVMIFPPLLLAWGKVEGEFKFRFFEDITRSANLPLVLFQVPVRSYWYDVETICRIAELEKVVAFKEASFDIDLFTKTVRQLKSRGASMAILSGNDRFVAESYRLGAAGALIGVANLATAKWAALDAAGRAEDFHKAIALQEELESLKALVFAEPIVEAVARIKIVLQHEGLIKSAAVRRPQLGVTEAEKKHLIASYRRLDDLDARSSEKIAAARKTGASV